jgi:acetylcholinesterase
VEVTRSCRFDLLRGSLQAPADQVVQNMKDFSCQIVFWLPVIEDNFGQERFLVEDPTRSFRSGNFNRVPVIAGRTELVYQSKARLMEAISDRNVEAFNEDFISVAPKCFFYWENDSKSLAMSKTLRKNFLNVSSFDESSKTNLSLVVSDGVIGYPMHKFVESVSSFADVYYYVTRGESKESQKIEFD